VSIVAGAGRDLAFDRSLGFMGRAELLGVIGVWQGWSLPTSGRSMMDTKDHAGLGPDISAEAK
jgi:hypothetical protein